MVGRVSLQASGHILYWMPRKRHMAKIMAKSCRESRCRLVRLGPHPSTAPALRDTGRARGILSTLLLWGLAAPPGGKPFSPAAGPLCAV